MKIDSIEIKSFAREEYTENQTPQIGGLGGDSFIIKGPNKSGKSLTFAALTHGILGNESPLEITVGRGNDITIGFTDGSEMYRGAPQRKYTVAESENGEHIGQLYEKDEADEKLRGNIGSVNLVKNHLIPSELQNLPLERHSGEDLVDLVEASIDRSAKLEIDEKKEELRELKKKENRLEDSLTPLKKDKSRRSLQISQQESQKEDWETIVDLSESGKLKEIQSKLSEKSEIEDRLQELSKRDRGLKRKITTKENEIEDLKRYEKSVEDIILEAMTEFVCPVCDGKVDTGTADTRMDEGRCPFCDENRSAAQVKKHIRNRKAEAEGRPGKLKTEIAELKTERSEVQSKIEDLEDDLPAISELNTFVVNELKKVDSIRELEEKAKSELDKVYQKLDEYEDDLTEIESEIEHTKDEIERVKEQREEVSNRVQELKAESFDNEFAEFQVTLNKHFTNIGGELGEGSSVRFDSETGEITLHSEDSEPRRYDRRSELSASEIQLLNVAFALSLNDHATSSNTIDWKILIMDEPFSNLDSEITEIALDYLLDLPQQVILTSSNDEVGTWFSDENTLQLSRSETTQAELGLYT